MHEGDKKPEAGHWAYQPDDHSSEHNEHAHRKSSTSDGATVEWTASEYIAHHKSFMWYFVLAVSAFAVSALLYLLTRDRITVGVVLFCALIFGIAGARKPRVLPYRLDRHGLTIGTRFYPFGNYKAFAIVDEGSFSSIFFMPIKRFMPGLTIYYAPDDEERIIDALASRLPMQPPTDSMFDHLMRRIRF